MTAQKTAKSLAPITVRVRRTTSFRVSADLKCRLLATDETILLLETASHARAEDAAYCYRPRTVARSVVCVSVCVLVPLTYCAKIAEPIEMPFGGCLTLAQET